MLSPKRQIYEVMGMLVNSMEEILSQCICISNHHIIHFKLYFQLYLNEAGKKKSHGDANRVKKLLTGYSITNV